MNDSEFNPYEVLDSETTTASRNGLQVDGMTLWIPQDQTLPSRCVFTNLPCDWSDYSAEKLVWKGRTFRLKLSAEVCGLTYAMSRPIRRSLKVRATLQWVYRIAFIGMLVTYGFHLLFVAAVGLGEVSCWIWSRSLGYRPLQILNSQDGRFQVTGFCSEFLRSLEGESDPYQGAGETER